MGLFAWPWAARARPSLPDLLLQPRNAHPRRDHLVEFLALFAREAGRTLWPNTSPNQAMMRASIGSFLASCPADLAKWRTRLASAITTSKPASRSNASPAPLVAAAGLHHRFANTAVLSARPAARDAPRRCWQKTLPRQPPVATSTFSLATSMPTVLARCGILQLPSSPCGLEAHATVRV